MKKILITGGSGFLGSHLCDRLIEDNEIICLDNFFSGEKTNIKHLLNHPNFELLRHDVITPICLEVDEIYNLACPASPKNYQYDPIKTIKTSVMGAINMLDIAQKTGAKILQTSTSEVYGDPKEHPQTENYWGNVNPIGIRSCYDEGKRCAESLFINYHNKNNVDISIARIFNTYGSRMSVDDGRVVSNFIVQALKGEDITIYGDGSQTRSFCYVDDTINGLIKLMNDTTYNKPINIGNPNEFSILTLAELVLMLTHSTSKIVYKKLPSDDPLQRNPNITIAKKVLNWEPVIKLVDGLMETINYFRKILG